MKAVATALLLALVPCAVMAASDDDFPLSENRFVEAIGHLAPTRIKELLGDPARAIEIKDESTGHVIGQIWHFEYLNTSEQGDYYKTTELDIIGDHVVTVVFSNSELEAGTVAGANLGECAATC